jgi:hypothetical protein
MMQAGPSHGDGEGSKNYSGGDKSQFNLCDSSSDEFTKAWLALKEVHDKELHHLQAKLTAMRKAQLIDGRRIGLYSIIKSITQQYDVFNDLIHVLRDQLSSKTCDHCLMNEACKNKLLQEFSNMQQQNHKYIAEFHAERKKLEQQNKSLSARIKASKQHYYTFSDSDDDDFIPCTQKTKSVFRVKDPSEATPVHLPTRPLQVTPIKQMPSRYKRKMERRSKIAISFLSQDLFDMPETSFEKTYNNDEPTTECSTNQKSFLGFSLMSTVESQKQDGFQVIKNHPEVKVGQLKRKLETNVIEKESMQQWDSRIRSPWSISSDSSETIPIYPASQSSEENMPDYNSCLLPSFKQKKEVLPLNIFPLDYTSRSNRKKRSTFAIPCYDIGFSVASGSSGMPSKEVVLKSVSQSTGTGYGTEKSESDSDSKQLFGARAKKRSRVTFQKKK